MKTLSKVTLYSLIAAAIIAGCSKDKNKTIVEEQTNVCTTCVKTPEAVAANNTSNKGVYKGVVIGSTGTIKFDLANNGTAIVATMVIDGVSVTLTSTTAVVAGQRYSAKFTGTLNGSPVELTFKVDGNGQNPEITLPTIPGHPNASFLVQKETSTQLMEGFTGTYSNTKPESGTFNMIICRSAGTWSVIARANGSTEVHIEAGTIQGDKLYDAGNKVIATLTGDTLAGTFTGGNNNTEVTTVSGHRSL